MQEALSGIQQYPFIQCKVDCISLNLASSSSLSAGDIAILQQKTRNEVDEHMALGTNQVTEIRRTAL